MRRIVSKAQMVSFAKIPFKTFDRLTLFIYDRIVAIKLSYVDREAITPTCLKVAAGVGQDVTHCGIDLNRTDLLFAMHDENVAVRRYMQVAAGSNLNRKCRWQEFVAFSIGA